ncbi:MAG: cation:proton antiporter [Nanoarchaeota archaeon]
MDALTFLTYLAVILLIGILCTLVSQRFKIPNVLLLLLAGLLFTHLPLSGLQLTFPPIFLTSIAILALVMIVFDAASRFEIKEFGELSIYALKLAVVFLFLNMFILTAFSMLIFNINSVFLALVFAFLMSGTDPATVMVTFKGLKNKVVELLEVESLLNTPLIILLPFLILDIISELGTQGITFSRLLDQLIIFLPDFFLRFVAGIGSGVLVGLIVLRIMRKDYSEILSPLALITAALLTYILAENLGGNGVLAITTLGLMFGNIYVKEKLHLFEFSSMFANSLEILVFFLVGLIIEIPFTGEFFLKSISLFIIYLIIRLSAIHISFYKLDYTFKEKIFMALNVQKGIAVAVVAFTLTTLDIPGIDIILNLTIAFMLYSILLATFVDGVSYKFLRLKPVSGAKK